MENYLGLVEFSFVALFAMAWAVLEWQGRRLDRKKDAERAAAEKAENANAVSPPSP